MTQAISATDPTPDPTVWMLVALVFAAAIIAFLHAYGRIKTRDSRQYEKSMKEVEKIVESASGQDDDHR